MSKYLNKQAVLSHLHKKREEYLVNSDLFEMEAIEQVIDKIQSGAFDADNSEIQRLRAALERIKERAKDESKSQDRRLCHIENIADEALSQLPTKPSGAEQVREIWEFYTSHGDYSITNAIEEVLNALGITVPGITEPEGDGNDI